MLIKTKLRKVGNSIIFALPRKKAARGGFVVGQDILIEVIKITDKTEGRVN